jgi:hypothetical protein
MSDASLSASAKKHPVLLVITILALIVAVVTFILILVFVGNHSASTQAVDAAGTPAVAPAPEPATAEASYGVIDVDLGNYYIHSNDALGEMTDEAPESIDDVEYQIPEAGTTDPSDAADSSDPYAVDGTLPTTSFGY